jgi:hypothetical protein
MNISLPFSRSKSKLSKKPTEEGKKIKDELE